MEENLASPIPPKTKNLPLIVLSVLLVLSLGGMGFLGWQNYQLKQQITQPEPVLNQEQPSSFEKNSEIIPVIFYTEEISYEETSNRGWPTVKLFRKVGNQEPEELAEVGKINEFPADFILSSDKKFILVNLESKLQLLNLETKSLEDLFTCRKQCYPLFSPDGSRLFIWDQEYASSDKEYFVHNFDLSNRKNEVIKQGLLENDLSYLFPAKWRDDNKIIMKEPQGGVWHYNLNDNSFQRLSPDVWDIWDIGPISESGRIMGVPKTAMIDDCNDYCGCAIGSYKIIDPVTGQKMDSLGNDQNIVRIIAFSPDDTEIIYLMKDPIIIDENLNDDEKRWQKCTELYKKQKETALYYKKKIGFDEKGVLIENPQSFLQKWNIILPNPSYEAQPMGIYVKSEKKNEEWEFQIFVNDKSVYTSNKDLQLQTVYYQ